ncbi:MAG: hypothetical protein AAGA55_04970 [Planctomycetota bacterium]
MYPQEPTTEFGLLASTLANSAQTLPEGGMVPLAIGLVAGLALWLAGVKIVRGVFLAIGAAVGGFAGAVLIPLTGLPAFDIGPITLNPGFTGLIAGGIIGALVAMGMLRVVIVFTAAGAFAVAGAMAALVFLHVSPPSETGITAEDKPGLALHEPTPPLIDFEEQARQIAAERLVDGADSLTGSVPEGTAASELLDELNTEENRERIRDAAERSRAFVAGVYDKVMADFDSRPARSKMILLAATLSGLAIGLLMGGLMPKRSSALVTSLFGSALWLAAGNALIRANTGSTPDVLDQAPLVWAVLWGVATVVGMAVQFGLIKRRGSGGSEDEDEE